VEGKDLPMGLQLAGRPFADGLLLKVAHAYEQTSPWHTRRPPI
jgi:aspartyl-tRNA(Asn)/glutamyl-tRNA(Gln) amidotransferase subunit A